VNFTVRQEPDTFYPNWGKSIIRLSYWSEIQYQWTFSNL